MYHAIVRRIARRNFELVGRNEVEPLLATCAPDVHHRFGGDHPLGGERHDRDALRRWFARLARLTADDFQFEIRDVWAKGWPWRTTVIIRWIARQTLPDGSAYANHGVHVVALRWGTVIDIDANENSQLVADSMKVWAAAGRDDATAPPILS
jgi:ketosteroid isomerase-like protein